jgi:hypothetical protein
MKMIVMRMRVHGFHDKRTGEDVNGVFRVQKTIAGSLFIGQIRFDFTQEILRLIRQLFWTIDDQMSAKLVTAGQAIRC